MVDIIYQAADFGGCCRHVKARLPVPLGSRAQRLGLVRLGSGAARCEMTRVAGHASSRWVTAQDLEDMPAAGWATCERLRRRYAAARERAPQATSAHQRRFPGRDRLLGYEARPAVCSSETAGAGEQVRPRPQRVNR